MSIAEFESDLAALEWLLTSPPLLSAAAPGSVGSHASVQRFTELELGAIRAWLADLRVSPHDFVDFMSRARDQARTSNAPGRLLSEPLRLGRLAERLLEYFLRFGPLHTHVASNLPIRFDGAGSDRTTVGEIDFLLRSPTGEPLHWELAVKYFLCQVWGKEAAACDFKGPDSKETFDYKLHKLLVRQLSHDAPAPHGGLAWQPQAVARGWMFYRFGHAVPRCDVLSADHLRGWWLPLDEVNQLNPRHRYVELPRSRWMPPLRMSMDATDGANLSSLAARLTQAWSQQAACQDVPHAWPRVARAQALGKSPSARLVAELMPHVAAANQWVEVCRYFVLPT